MRNSNELNVDATRHAIRAEERTRANGRLHRVFDQPEVQTPKADRWWQRYFKWETLTVAGRTIEKGWVVTPGIAAVLLAAFLGVLGWAYKSSTADSRETRESIIRMETMLNERTRTFNEQQAKLEAEVKEERDMARVYRERQTEKMTSIDLALKQSGIKIAQ